MAHGIMELATQRSFAVLGWGTDYRAALSHFSTCQYTQRVMQSLLKKEQHVVNAINSGSRKHGTLLASICKYIYLSFMRILSLDQF